MKISCSNTHKHICGGHYLHDLHAHSQQRPKVTTVRWLRRPRLALRVRVERLLHFLLLPLFSAAAFGPFRHLAEEAEFKQWASQLCFSDRPPQTGAETRADYSSVAMNASAWVWCSQTKSAIRSALRSDSQRTNSVHKLMLEWSFSSFFCIDKCQHQVMPSWPVAEMVFV